MRRFVGLLALLTLCGCATEIGPNQADGSDCNAAIKSPCGGASFCDAGKADAHGDLPRRRRYGFLGQGMHAVGTCRPKGARGAVCNGVDHCLSGRCVHPMTGERPAENGVCE